MIGQTVLIFQGRQSSSSRADSPHLPGLQQDTFFSHNKRIINRDLVSVSEKLSGAWLRRIQQKVFTSDLLDYRVNPLPESLDVVTWPKQINKCTFVYIPFITKVGGVREHSLEANRCVISLVKKFKVLFMYRCCRENAAADLQDPPVYRIKRRSRSHGSFRES